MLNGHPQLVMLSEFSQVVILSGFSQLVILSDRRERRISLLSAVWPELEDEILRGIYPEPRTQILRVAQDDSRRRAQDDRKAKDSG